MADDNVLNDPGLMDPSTEFGSMMQHAMKLKGHQMEADRKRFEAWPSFMQNTLWMQGEPLELRMLPVAERLARVAGLKERGNELFRKQAYAGAIEQYEAALGSFRYAKQLDPDWKKKGIKDETIELVDERGEAGSPEAEQIAALFVSCYCNLAACYLGRAGAGTPEPGSTVETDYKRCAQACGCALEIEPACSKALYRRARALSEPTTATDPDIEAAIRDLGAAAAAAPDDKAVRVLLAKLKRGKADAKAKDKAAMTGMFSKGELYDAKSLKESEERRNAERRLAENGGKPGPRTLEDCEAEAKEGDAAVTHLRSRGQDADADALEAKVAAHRAQLEAHKRKAADGSFRPDEIDFSNPTEEQIADAKEHGVDLFDPLVRQELMQLQKRRGRGDDVDEEEEPDAPAEPEPITWTQLAFSYCSVM